MSWRLIVLAIIYTIEPYIWLKSMSTLGWKNEKLKRYSWVFFLGYYILTLVKQYVAFTKDTGGEWTICFGILLNLYMILSFFWFKGSILKRIYTIGLFFICVYIAEMTTLLFVIAVFHIPSTIFLDNGLINIVCTLFTKVLLIPISYIVFCKKNKNMISLLYKNKELLPLIILTFIFEMVTFIIFSYQKLEKMSPDNMIIVVLSQVILLSTMFYISIILKRVKAELEQKKEIIRLTNSLDNLRHDMSSHVRMLKSYAKRGQYDELMDYMNKHLQI